MRIRRGREADTERLVALAGQIFETDPELLETALTDIFAQDIREVTMEARDTTVHILKKFGAETTGAPFSFYRGTVTPMRLTREAFWNSHTGGQI